MTVTVFRYRTTYSPCTPAQSIWRVVFFVDSIPRVTNKFDTYVILSILIEASNTHTSSDTVFALDTLLKSSPWICNILLYYGFTTLAWGFVRQSLKDTLLRVNNGQSTRVKCEYCEIFSKPWNLAYFCVKMLYIFNISIKLGKNAHQTFVMHSRKVTVDLYRLNLPGKKFADLCYNNVRDSKNVLGIFVRAKFRGNMLLSRDYHV